MDLVSTVLGSWLGASGRPNGPQSACCTPSLSLHATSTPSLLSLPVTRPLASPAHVSLLVSVLPGASPGEAWRGPQVGNYWVYSP